MKKTVWTFGLISGAILSVMMMITMPFEEKIGYDRAEIIGYTTMVLSFLLIFFGVRSYRDNVGKGTIGFGRAFAVGALICAVASLCYVATWEVIYFKFLPNFTQKFQARALEKAKASGASQAEIDKQAAQFRQYAELYENPLINSAITFLEPLPVGLLIALVSAGVLRRRRRGDPIPISASPAVF